MTKDWILDVRKTEVELAGEIQAESQKLSRALLAVFLGKEKRTHLVKASRQRLARLKTIFAQKRFSSERVSRPLPQRFGESRPVH